MPTITWQFSTPKAQDFVSKSIKEMTGSEISHVDVLTPDGKLLGAHATGGVQIREPNYEDFGLRIRVTVPVTQEQFDKFFAYVNSKVGEPYNHAAIAGIAMNRDMSEAGHEMCSQLQYEGTIAAGLLQHAKQPNMVSPEAFRFAISTRLDASEQRIPQ